MDRAALAVCREPEQVVAVLRYALDGELVIGSRARMSEPNPNIRLGIAGSGAIAIGLAKAAGPNVDTVLRARSEESAERARSRLDDNVRVVTDIGEFGDRTYVVEAISRGPRHQGRRCSRRSPATWPTTPCWPPRPRRSA